MTAMQAVWLTGHGGNEVVRVGERPTPSGSAGEVLVRIHAAGLNRVDLYMRNSGAGIRHSLPLVMGLDGAGTVLEAEPGSGFEPGDRVVIHPGVNCGHCEFCRVVQTVLCTSMRLMGEHIDGTLAEVVRYLTAPDGNHHAVCQGQGRFRVLEFVATEPVPIARIERIPEQEPAEGDTRIEALFHALKQQAQEVLQLAPGAPEDLANAVQAVGSPAMLADMVATFMDAPVEERQEILETVDLRKRLELVSQRLAHAAEVLRLSHKIREDTKGTLEKAQREYFLREQLRQIQKELGETDEKSVELAELSEAIAKADMPEEAEREARRELKRLDRMPEGAAEASIVRTYLEVMTELPWSKSTEDRIDIERARKILDQDHYGLQQVKKRILEYLAVRKLNPEGKSQSLCLVGPPGVGKTSLGKSIARAMGREFVRVSLGGVHDEAEVRGHRRTYVGAMPGNIVTGMRKVAVNNPVFVLDEMDKLGRGLHGDPSAALLEVLDPEQNSTFRDNYLGVDFDLHRVLFVGTANVLDTIPPALLDRFEVIRLPGYTAGEKLEIARRYLVKRQREDA